MPRPPLPKALCPCPALRCPRPSAHALPFQATAPVLIAPMRRPQLWRAQLWRPLPQGPAPQGPAPSCRPCCGPWPALLPPPPGRAMSTMKCPLDFPSWMAWLHGRGPVRGFGWVGHQQGGWDSSGRAHGPRAAAAGARLPLAWRAAACGARPSRAPAAAAAAARCSSRAGPPARRWTSCGLPTAQAATRKQTAPVSAPAPPS
jgi:hypothetical protein